ncbi:MAG TPA: DEAD/DEAH box helicase family protein, partial [Candidatus Nanoarchaeia archaeon]|nr:DEAD/DEAH box helicase family protein [Candidatus Nanoarchaeia archaeon]
TGSGKTLIMAGLILDLYEKGYRNFLFFVNSSNIIKKTIENFINETSSKYLFNNKIVINNKEIKVKKVDNFEGTNKDDINICFTTIQKLHSDLYTQKENSLTPEDFKDKKIVFISDEAHHGQVQTKQQPLLKEFEKPNWENTVESIFNKNKENLLLEFTATMDFMNKFIEQKYLNKIIYKYDLRSFRNDKYSKEIEILRSDADKKGRILIAVILNQYRQDVASKYGVELKPIILFKAQKTIEQSKDNKILFHKTIEELSKKEIEEIKRKTDIEEIKRAFQFYDSEKINLDILVSKIKSSFEPNKCLSVNDETEMENYQLTLNSLEDKDNKIRVIFAVQKLNEGWDVLNLYDIVRLYEGQSAGGNTKGGVSPATISEAQLIGRGARYFPFRLKKEDIEPYKRKFDEDLDNDLRILEELHFHSYNESRYIAELKTALVNEGLIDDKTVEKELKLKDSFKKTIFYRDSKIYLNSKVENDYSYVKSFEDLGVKDKDFKYELYSFKGNVSQAMTDNQYDNLNIKKEPKTISIKEIDYHVVYSALARNEFFKFNNIKRFCKNINSIREFITKKEYLAEIKITFWATKEDINDISNKDKYLAVIKVLGELEDKLRGNFVEYIGSNEFVPNKLSDIFTNKKIKVEKGSEREDGQEDLLKDKEWYVFNANYGTGEEKAFITLINRLIEENFKAKFKEIYLIRNELHFKIYNFKDGQAFAPDFVLFMKTKSGENLTYQIFIEPKGQFLEEKDKWKEDFMREIKDKFNSSKLVKFIETRKYKLVGLPFYNQTKENEFKDSLIDSLK